MKNTCFRVQFTDPVWPTDLRVWAGIFHIPPRPLCLDRFWNYPVSSAKDTEILSAAWFGWTVDCRPDHAPPTSCGTNSPKSATGATALLSLLHFEESLCATLCHQRSARVRWVARLWSHWILLWFNYALQNCCAHFDMALPVFERGVIYYIKIQNCLVLLLWLNFSRPALIIPDFRRSRFAPRWPCHKCKHFRVHLAHSRWLY
jgi:hypothetical protein